MCSAENNVTLYDGIMPSILEYKLALNIQRLIEPLFIFFIVPKSKTQIRGPANARNTTPGDRKKKGFGRKKKWITFCEQEPILD